MCHEAKLTEMSDDLKRYPQAKMPMDKISIQTLGSCKKIPATSSQNIWIMMVIISHPGWPTGGILTGSPTWHKFKISKDSRQRKTREALEKLTAVYSVPLADVFFFFSPPKNAGFPSSESPEFLGDYVRFQEGYVFFV